MKFVHPEILWGLAATAIPIIVHLFNFRKFKKVMFSNVAFLNEIQHETKSKSKLKHLLILISRIFAIICLVSAFAQPYFPTSSEDVVQGDKAVSIYIDNSFSNEAKSGSGVLLDIAKNKAIKIVEAHAASDKFQLITNDFEGRHQRFVGIDEMVQLIQEVELSPAVRTIGEVVSRQNDLLTKAEQKARISYLLSDLQKNTFDFERIQTDSTIRYRFVPGSAILADNISIDSVWFGSPIRQLNQVEKLFVRLRNHSEQEKESVNVTLRIDKQQKSVASTNVPANAYTDVELSYTNTESGIKQCEVTIDDYPVSFDNSYFFNYQVANKINILQINGNVLSDGIRAVRIIFSDDPYFNFSESSANSVDFSTFGKNDIIILNEIETLSSGLILEIQKFVDAGGTALLIPSPSSDITSYNSLFTQLTFGNVQGKMSYGFTPGNPVNFIDYNHYLLKGVLQQKASSNEKIDFPNVGSYYKIALLDRTNANDIVRMQSGDPFFIVGRKGNGQFMSFAVSAAKEESGLLNHSLFPTLLLRAAESSIRQKQLAFILGKENKVIIPNLAIDGESTFRLKLDDSNEEIIPEHRSSSSATEVFVPTELKKSGQYNLLLGDSLRDVFSMNFDRRESNLQSFAAADIQEWISNQGLNNVSVVESEDDGIGKIATDLNEGKKLWYTLIVWTLIFLAIEILLIKYLK